jgi:hypothetical protein
VHVPYRATIVAVSTQMGLISAQTYTTAVNEQIFLDFIPKLSLAMGGEPFFLFLDRLSVHRMKTVDKCMRDNKITPVFNCAGFPDGNPIEICFS